MHIIELGFIISLVSQKTLRHVLAFHKLILLFAECFAKIRSGSDSIVPQRKEFALM